MEAPMGFQGNGPSIHVGYSWTRNGWSAHRHSRHPSSCLQWFVVIYRHGWCRGWGVPSSEGPSWQESTLHCILLYPSHRGFGNMRYWWRRKPPYGSISRATFWSHSASGILLPLCLRVLCGVWIHIAKWHLGMRGLQKNIRWPSMTVMVWGPKFDRMCSYDWINLGKSIWSFFQNESFVKCNKVRVAVSTSPVSV